MTTLSETWRHLAQRRLRLMIGSLCPNTVSRTNIHTWWNLNQLGFRNRTNLRWTGWASKGNSLSSSILTQSLRLTLWRKWVQSGRAWMSSGRAGSAEKDRETNEISKSKSLWRARNSSSTAKYHLSRQHSETGKPFRLWSRRRTIKWNSQRNWRNSQISLEPSKWIQVGWSSSWMWILNIIK